MGNDLRRGEFPCSNVNGVTGCGVLFELTNNNGTWIEQVIHAFSGPPDGAQPEGGLTLDPATGSYYGTTQYGGDPVCNCGTVFQLTPNGDGTWTESVLYTFQSQGLPNGGVTLDAQGNLYGTTFGDIQGRNGGGYVYELSGGKLSILYSFMGQPDGQNPNGPPVLDSAGNLLGTTFQGGTYGLGTIFELSPSQNGWQEAILHSFAYNNQFPTDGRNPSTDIAMDSRGNFWGTVLHGGASSNGVFYELEKEGSTK